MQRRTFERARFPSVLCLLLLFASTFFVVVRPALAGNPCAECHQEQVDLLLAGPHRGVVNEGASMCAACHGDPGRHLETGEAADIKGMEALSRWNREEQADACLGCHGSDFPSAHEAPHYGRVSCWTCHSEAALHSRPEGAVDGTARRHFNWKLCTACHNYVAAEFRLQYRHPVEEGLMDCLDCHDIHGKATVLQAGSAGVQRSACLQCHPEQRGPYLFEHQPVEKGCSDCHRPHGSWNRSLMVSTGNGVCLTCHMQSSFPGIGKVPHNFRLNGGARCWDCHSDVHGSNTTPDFNPRGRR